MVTVIDAGAWVDRFVRAADDQRAALGELDRQAGDGDFGTNLSTSLARAREELRRAGASPGAPFMALSTAFLNTGGTSGPLYGIFFREIAAAADGGGELDLQALSLGVLAGTAIVRRLGGASVGDRTMVDAMQPAANALASAAGAGLDLEAALARAAEAARAGAEHTADMVARRGRASYVGDVALGVLDPGAVMVAIFFEAGLRTDD